MTHRLHSRERCLYHNSAGLEGNLRTMRAYAAPLETVGHSHLDPQSGTRHNISMEKINY